MWLSASVSVNKVAQRVAQLLLFLCAVCNQLCELTQPHEHKLHHPCPVDTEPHWSTRNTLADSEAKRGSTLSQSSVPIHLASAKAQIRRTGQQEFHTCHLADPHSATHRTLIGEVSPQFHRRLGWSRSECITVTQLRTGHSPLLASYLHRIGWQQSPLCPHCGGDDETAQHLLLSCPTHMQARTSTNYTDSIDAWHMMSFLEMIGVVTCPPDREWERERVNSASPSLCGQLHSAHRDTVSWVEKNHQHKC